MNALNVWIVLGYRVVNEKPRCRRSAETGTFRLVERLAFFQRSDENPSQRGNGNVHHDTLPTFKNRPKDTSTTCRVV